MTPPVDEVKAAARGQWLSILTAAGLPAISLNGKNGPCPKCGGTDRFAAFKDVTETGGVNCRKCHNQKNGDGIATLQWWRSWTFQEATAFLAEQVLSGTVQTPDKAKPRMVAAYDYRDEVGNVHSQSVRFVPKKFKQRRPDGKGGWTWNVDGVRVLPYRLPELLAEPTLPVVIPEGEKDCDNLAGIGVVATTNAGGAGNWTANHSEFLRGRHVIVLPDNDETGRNHAQKVAQSLQGIAESVRIVELPDLPDKGDVSDWIASGGTKDQLMRLAAAAPLWTSATAQPWPAVVSFDVLELPEFPTHVLPDVLSDWVEAESHATQTPADLPALLSISVCSACIARRVVVEPRPGWLEPVNVYTAVLLEPGNRKSGVYSDAVKPFREFEAELIEDARPAIARSQSDRRQGEARLKKLERRAAEKGDAEARHDAFKLAEELSAQAEPALPRLIADDATAEKLGMLLAEQGGRIASLSPEGGVFDLMAGMYSKNGMAQFDVYLKGHSGDDLITDRVSRKSVRVSRPAITCGYAIQPQVIKGLAGNAAFRGRGLLARYLYAAPQSWIGSREIAPAAVPEATREAYHRTVRALAELEGEFVLRLSEDASALLLDWEAEIEGMLGDGGQMELMRDWGAKLAGATLRLAAVLHCVEHGDAVGRIERHTLSAAIAIAKYLIPHAEAVLSMMLASDDVTQDEAHYVLRWIERHRRAEFTKSEVQHHGKRRFPRADDVDPALAELKRRGYIRTKPTEANGPGRPSSPTYDVNPAVFEDAKSKKRSHNSRNSAGGPKNVNCGNNGSALTQSETCGRVRVTL